MLRVTLDAGHGGSDLGACYQGSYEKDYTLKFCDGFQRIINRRYNGFVDCFVTRTTDDYLTLASRGKITEANRSHLVISIHVNAIHIKSMKGCLLFYWPNENNKHARNLCLRIIKSYPEQLLVRANRNHLYSVVSGHNDNDNWLQRPNNVLFPHSRHSDCILIELGYMSNKDDWRLLNTTSIINGIQSAIMCGIDGYFFKRF